MCGLNAHVGALLRGLSFSSFLFYTLRRDACKADLYDLWIHFHDKCKNIHHLVRDHILIESWSSAPRCCIWMSGLFLKMNIQVLFQEQQRLFRMLHLDSQLMGMWRYNIFGLITLWIITFYSLSFFFPSFWLILNYIWSFLQVDNRELKEVLDYALLMLESLSPCVENFLPKVKFVGYITACMISNFF